jgi:hypothetical protein
MLMVFGLSSQGVDSDIRYSKFFQADEQDRLTIEYPAKGIEPVTEHTMRNGRLLAK